MNIKDMEKVVIPKIFTVDNYNVHLKHEIVGCVVTYSDGSYQYIAEKNKIRLNIIDRDKFVEDMKIKILDLYKNNIGELSKNDEILCSLIDYVIDTTSIKYKVLFIGYKFNYPTTIINTLEQCNFSVESLLLDKNMELYNPKLTNVNNNFAPIFDMIKNKIYGDQYDCYVIDIPNLTLYTDYVNTRKVLMHLEGQDKKMLILTPGPMHRFEKIFGTVYSKIVLDSKYIINFGKEEFVKNKINAILR